MTNASSAPSDALLRLSDFDYALPEALIALRPANPRSAARLLHVTAGGLKDRRVADLPALLRPGDLLVVNDTKVIPARLKGVRRRGEAAAQISATLIERIDAGAWRALAKPGKRLKLGERIGFGRDEALSAEVIAKAAEGGGVDLKFDRAGPALDAAIAAIGEPPLPPYIAARRGVDAADAADYQTAFAEKPGAVAAPTASLHFDAPLLEALAAAGVAMARVTLHVGAGTFLPVASDDPREHKMHREWGALDETAAAAIAETKARGGRVIAVGTTALRVLETAALRTEEGGAIQPWNGETDLFIMPGFRFRAVDALLTNFHLPRTTLLMLTAALVGRERILAAYAHAVAAGYRFYSYGDATLLEP